MNADLSALLDHLAAMGREMSPDTIDALASRIQTLSKPADLVVGMGSTPRARALLGRLGELWQESPSVDPASMAASLRCAQRTAEVVGKAQVVELIWTGPSSPSVPVRRTDQALFELIESADRELVIVSFAAYKVSRVLEALERALDRGVTVRFVLESKQASGGRVDFDPIQAIGSLLDRVEVYTWAGDERPTDEQGRRGALHAKCAVADGHIALISSANLTEFALALNMEMGVLIRGGRIPLTVSEHFDRLIAEGILERVDART